MIESSDLLKEYPIIFYPSLAVKLGLTEAIIVQKLHFFLSIKDCGKVVDGRHWIFNTIEQWREVFPFYCEKTIRSAFRRLEEMHIVESCQPDGRMSRKKYYRINEGIWVKLLKGTIPNPDAVKITASKWKELPLPKHGVLHKDSLKKSKETPSVEGVNFSSDSEKSETFQAVWKPIDSGTKSEQLSRIKPPRDYPSEREFDELIENHELDQIGMGKRGNLYSDLCDNKWHHWDGRRWRKIRDWEKYITALDSKMKEATEIRAF